MKSKLQMQTLAASLVLIASLAAASAQPAPHRVPAVKPAAVQPAPAALIDPTTGLPVPPAAPLWIDDNWKDPALVLTNVAYDNLPLAEVAHDLRERFKDHFDILPMPRTFEQDWGATFIQLQMKNVKASEVFNAMNMIFENDHTPLRWELKANGRPLVQLRVLPDDAVKSDLFAKSKPVETHRMVYFVGNLVGDEKSSGMTMEQIVKTISEIWPRDFGRPEGVFQFHKEAQVLIVNGTREQLEFIHQTLAALELKAQQEKARRISADLQSKVDGVKNQKTNSGDAK